MLVQAFVRRQNDTGARYGFHWNGDPGKSVWEIKYDGVPTPQVRILETSNAAPAVQPGDVMRIEVRGNLIEGFLNGILIISATDMDPSAILSTGRPGTTYRFAKESPAVTPTPVVESWNAGDLPPLNNPPNVNFLSPNDGDIFISPATISFAANATDSDGTVVKVEFFEDANKLGEDLTSPYSFNWTSVGVGGYVLTARAIDDDGDSTTSAAVNISVIDPSNIVPTVSLTSPLEGDTFTAPATVAIAGIASDSDGTIAKVEFFEGANKLGEDLTSPYSFNWTNVAAGRYALTSKATDNDGDLTTSVAINITVNGPFNTPPSSFNQTLNMVENKVFSELNLHP